jgi:hypothetical protein
MSIVSTCIRLKFRTVIKVDMGAMSTDLSDAGLRENYSPSSKHSAQQKDEERVRNSQKNEHGP